MSGQAYSPLDQVDHGHGPPDSPSLHHLVHADQDEELNATFDDSLDPSHQLLHSRRSSEQLHLSLPLLADPLQTSGSHSRSLPPPSSGPAYNFDRDSYHPHASLKPPPPPPLHRLSGMGGGIQNDGVFTNLSAKPEGPRINPFTGELEYVNSADDGSSNPKDEILPTYDSAALDSAPPYWETTVTLPGGGGPGSYGLLGPDDVLVDGLPVGNLFGFAWNLLVSMSFQFIGFLLTYLLHTTHAAKNGSRAGLGITLIQYGLYTRTRVTEIANGGNPADSNPHSNDTRTSFPPTTTDPWGLFGPSSSSKTDWDGSSSVTNRPGSRPEMPYDGVSTSEQIHLSTVANEWLSYMLIAIGWFLLLGALINYWRAVRWARAVRSEESLGGTMA